MNCRRLLALAAFSLNACSTTLMPDTGTVMVRWHRVEDPHKFCAPRIGANPQGRNWKGCAFFDRDGICHIAARDFRDVWQRDEMATFGHELKHCFDGRWHQ